MRQLQVYLYGVWAGTLAESGDDTLSYLYAPSYSGPPLSLSLPVRREPYGNREARRFFSCLMPDRQFFLRLGRERHGLPSDLMSFLGKYGADCAGAVAFSPVEAGCEGERDVTPLIDQWLAMPDDERRMSLFAACRARLSIAGAQDKLPCIAGEGRYVLPASGTPTTHIVKPPSPFFPGLPENEALCLELARACGLPAGESWLDARRGGALFVARRWDRVRRGGRTERIHQEDMRQVLGLRPGDKYQESGGYDGFPSLFDAARRHGVRGAGGGGPAMFLAMAAVFSWLVGNGDAHAGNFAVLHKAQGPEFAPLYDIVCTRVYPGLTAELAMRIGGASDARAVWEEDFALLAGDLELAPELVLAEAHRQKDALRRRLAFLPKAGDGTVRAVADFVEARCADVDCWQDPRPCSASLALRP